jgi:hypothetical protein
MSAWVGIDITEKGTSVFCGGGTTCKLPFGVITKGKRMKEGVSNEGIGGSENYCEVGSQTRGNATLLRCSLSDVVKSVSEKCLYKYYYPL